MAIFGKEKFECVRCGQKSEPLGFAPIPTELGEQIGTEICAGCWQEWLQKQNQLINHFGLDLSKTDTHEYLFDQMQLFFFDKGGELDVIDTTQEGKVSW
ncbi:MAG: Fe(2+)-trafficking protein [Pyrinomonadaceae bacterium]